MIEKIKSIYMIGVGGISMSALARFFALQGHNCLWERYSCKR